MPLLAGMLLAAPVVADTSIDDFARFLAASRRAEAGEAVTDTDRYRAGFYSGYLSAVRERLGAAGEACPGACRCQLDEALANRLDRISDRRQAALPEVEALIREQEGCPPGGSRIRLP